MKYALAAIAAAMTALIAAPTVHADEQGYLDAVRPLPWFFPGDAYELRAGQNLCNWMRNGISPDEAVSRMNTPMTPMTVNITPWDRVVDAAQHELCPDTL